MFEAHVLKVTVIPCEPQKQLPPLIANIFRSLGTGKGTNNTAPKFVIRSTAHSARVYNRRKQWTKWKCGIRLLM